ncbi:hypothetical protein [Pantoea sp. NGS-ED-1003]|uniref:hypothetical protein n=1 Tax=Pantoea sp. NGS-ED-1003 TaxID=1526743 RepID=UPI000535661C|nr:hypothetical protein [Pantoea sp. NGS-ED-1003]
MSKDTGGCAFPFVPNDGTEWNQVEFGMTLRDYFAAKAMQGVFSSGCGINIGPSHSEEMDGLAKTFYLMADAMLRARGQ